MMYHFMLGLRAGSAAALSGAGTASPPLASVWFFSSSCIDCSALVCGNKFDSFPRLSDPDSAMPEIAEHRVNPVPDHQVHRPEIRREQEHRDDHHRGGGPHFLERGRGHLLHLGAHVVVESPDPLRPRLDAIAEIAAGSCQ